MPLEKTIDNLFIITIQKEEEFDLLHDFCIKHQINFPKSIFKEKNTNCIYAINNKSLGYAGTIIAMHTKDDQILHSVQEAERIIK